MHVKAKNPELDRLHEAASRRLESLKLNKQTLTNLKSPKKIKSNRIREKVTVTMEEEEQSVSLAKKELAAEEN